MNTIKIAIADNDVLFRQQLIFDLGLNKTFKIVSCVSNGIELVDLVKKESIDLIIVFAYLPYLSGIEAIRVIRKANPSINILIYTNTFQEDIYDILATGLSNGYCGKESEAIVSATNSIQINKKNFFDLHYHFEWKNKNIEYSDLSSYSAFKDLKPVEVRIIALSCEGKTNKEIASDLKLSSRTIDAYSTKILEKLGFRNKIELVQFAFLNGICTQNCPNVQSGVCIRKTIF